MVNKEAIYQIISAFQYLEKLPDFHTDPFDRST